VLPAYYTTRPIQRTKIGGLIVAQTPGLREETDDFRICFPQLVDTIVVQTPGQRGDGCFAIRLAPIPQGLALPVIHVAEVMNPSSCMFQATPRDQLLRLVLVHPRVQRRFLVTVRAQEQVGGDRANHKRDGMSQYHFHNPPFLLLFFTMQENSVPPAKKMLRLSFWGFHVSGDLGFQRGHVVFQNLDNCFGIIDAHIEHVEDFGNLSKRSIVADGQLLN
jgi:hypothetical protein